MLDLLQTAAYSQPPHWNVPATIDQVVAVNALLSAHTYGREERLALLSSWFNRPFSSSRDLTKAEASAIIDLGYQNHDSWEHSERFITFIESSKAVVYAF